MTEDALSRSQLILIYVSELQILNIETIFVVLFFIWVYRNKAIV